MAHERPHLQHEIITNRVKSMLESPGDYDWSLQGFGMLRTYLAPDLRLHIWDKEYQVDNVSLLHDHPWDFESYIVAGGLTNYLYNYNTTGMYFNRQRILCGVGGGLDGEPESVKLTNYQTDHYDASQSYVEKHDQIHMSAPADGTITIIKRHFTEDVDHANVFYDTDEWVSAEPRPATQQEVYAITAKALMTWF